MADVKKTEEKKRIEGEVTPADEIWAALSGWLIIIFVPMIIEFLFGFFIGNFWAGILRWSSFFILFIFVALYLWAPKGVWFAVIEVPESAKGFSLVGQYLGFIPVSNNLTYQKDDKYKKKNLVPFGHKNAMDGQIRFLPGVVRIAGGWIFFAWPFVRVIRRRFRWSRPKVSQDGLKDTFSEKEMDYAFLKKVAYSLNIPDVEDSEMTTFGVNVVIFAIIFNPFLAVVAVHDSLSAMFKRVETMIRLVSKRHTLDEWKGNKFDLEEEIVKDLGKYGDDLVLDEILGHFGYWVSIRVANIIPPAEKSNMAARKTAARDEAEIAEIKAIGEANATRQKADARVYEIKTTYAAAISYGDAGLLLSALTSLEKSPLAASVVVANVPGLKELFEKVGVKDSSSLTSKNINDAKKVVEDVLSKTNKNKKGGNP